MHPPTYQQLHFWVFVPEKTKIYIHTKTCMRLLTAASFLTAKNWKHPRCPSVGEWFNKLWHIHYSAKKKEPTVDTGDTLDESPENHAEWKKCRHPKVRYSTILFTQHCWKDRIMKMGNKQMSGCLEWEAEQGRDAAVKRARGILVRESSPSWLYLWQRPDCDLALTLIL